MARAPLLQISEITLGFGGNPVFDGLSLNVQPGDRVALVGRNGSGKSTLMKVMAGLIEADKGLRAVAPGVKAPEVVRYPVQGTDRQLALLQMPPLLRSYLGIGGWVSDHAVVDRAMNTLHVFTGVEIAAIPAARARALRAVAG